MTTEGLAEKIRGIPNQEDALRKHLGVYLPREVDQYIEKLLERMHAMEVFYQQRHEEIRTSLLGMTRERDELKERVRELESRLADVPQQWESILLDQGQVALPIEEVEQLRTYGIEAARQIKALTQERDEQARALAEMTAAAEAAAEQARDAAQQLEKRRQEIESLKTALEEARCLCEERADALKQAQAQYRTLAREYELARQAAEQLMEEKRRLEEEAEHSRQRWQAQRASIISRYQGMLRSQQQCMERLQESFIASVKCMQSLGEAGLQSCPIDLEEA